MIVKLLTEHYLEFLSLKGGCTGSSENTLGKMPHCLKSHVTGHLLHTVYCISWFNVLVIFFSFEPIAPHKTTRQVYVFHSYYFLIFFCRSCVVSLHALMDKRRTMGHVKVSQNKPMD